MSIFKKLTILFIISFVLMTVIGLWIDNINSKRVEELKNAFDKTKEVEPSMFNTAYPLIFTDSLNDIQGSNIFIITVPVLTHSVKVDLPKANNQPNQIQNKPITISVNKQGQIYWNESLIDQTHLSQKLQQIAQQQPQPEVHIRGDRKVEYEYVMQVMAEAQRNGVQKLGFITEPKS